MIVNSWKELCQSDLADIPQFIRFDVVQLDYFYFTIPIEEMCPLVVNYLQPLKKALNGSKLITFIGGIGGKDPSMFRNHLQLLNHIQDELLPMCDSSHGYKFKIQFNSDTNAAANVIRIILQMHPIDRCSNVEIGLYGNFEQRNQLPRLPIKAISNFLHRKCDKFREDSNKIIYLRINLTRIQNVQATCDHFKKVIKYFL